MCHNAHDLREAGPGAREAFNLDDALHEDIVEDITVNRRGFLPGGQAPVAAELKRQMHGIVEYGGLDRQASALLLSCLPTGASRLSVEPLDKGLSGASVMAGRYFLGNKPSKSFVLKIGESSKIEREARAVEAFVAPFIAGIEQPLVRVGQGRSLIGQELRGLTPSSAPTSLRNYVRDNGSSASVVERLLNVRLSPWYTNSSDPTTLPLSSICRWWLTKAPTTLAAMTPGGWEGLATWTQELTGAPKPTEGQLSRLLAEHVWSGTSIIHGDLHTQNVLVDQASQECWPIDFGWCAEDLPLVLDAVMLECSLKFLAIPMRADLRTLIRIEGSLAMEPYPVVDLAGVPFADEMRNCLAAVQVVRRFALDGPCPVSFSDYKKVLAVLTFCLSLHRGLNRPLVLSSVQVLLHATT